MQSFESNWSWLGSCFLWSTCLRELLKANTNNRHWFNIQAVVTAPRVEVSSLTCHRSNSWGSWYWLFCPQNLYFSGRTFFATVEFSLDKQSFAEHHCVHWLCNMTCLTCDHHKERNTVHGVGTTGFWVVSMIFFPDQKDFPRALKSWVFHQRLELIPSTNSLQESFRILWPLGMIIS